MAMYENLAHGVALVVPSLSFYQSIASALLDNGVALHLVDLEVLERRRLGWTAIEWFSNYFADVLVHFDSWEHLRYLLKTTDFLVHKQEVHNFMRGHTADVLQQWSDMLWCKQDCIS